MLISSTSEIVGRNAQKHCALLAADVICTVSVFKEVFSRFKDILGGRLHSYETIIARSRREALDELKRQAAEAHADAIVGLHIQHHWMGRPGSVLMVCAYGTAITLNPNDASSSESTA